MDERNLFYQLANGLPVPLHWNGWATNTHSLKKAGWDFHSTVDTDLLTNSYIIHLIATDYDGRIAIEGRASIYRVRLETSIQIEEILRNGFKMNSFHCKRDLVKLAFDVHNWANFKRVDVEETNSISFRQFYMGDFDFFKPAPVVKEVQKIILPYQSVDDCLDRILQLQYKGNSIIDDAQPKVMIYGV